MLLHGRQLVDGSERTQNTEGSESLERIRAAWSHQRDDGNAHDEEIEAVPGLTQVSVLAEHEAKCGDFDDGFKNEDDGKDKVDLLLRRRPARFVVWI